MPTAPTTIPPIPTPVPSTDDPANFDARADATLGALPGAVSGINSAAAVTYANAQEVAQTATDLEATASLAAGATDLLAFSTSTLTVDAGTKTIHFTAPKTGFKVNDLVAIVLRADPSIKLFGSVATFDGSDDMTVTVVSSGVLGSGTFSDWIICLAAFLSTGSTAAEVLAGASDASSVTPKSLADAAVWVVLGDGPTVTPNALNGRNFTWTIGGNRTLGAITNTKPGDTFLLEITQDGTGSRNLAWAAGVYVRAGGLPVLSTAAGAKDYLQLRVISVNGSGVATRVLASFSRGPTN